MIKRLYAYFNYLLRILQNYEHLQIFIHNGRIYGICAQILILLMFRGDLPALKGGNFESFLKKSEQDFFFFVLPFKLFWINNRIDDPLHG